MSKIICALLVVFALSVSAETIAADKQGWVIQRRQLNYPINPKGFNGYDFNTQASGIRYVTECSAPADIILLTAWELQNNLRNGRPFKYIYMASNSLRDFQTYYDRSVISQTVVAVAVNAYWGNTIYCNHTLEVRFNEQKAGEYQYNAPVKRN